MYRDCRLTYAIPEILFYLYHQTWHNRYEYNYVSYCWRGNWSDACTFQDCLNGEFVRVGPNPKFAPVAGYHWYDLLLFELYYFISLHLLERSHLCWLSPLLICRFDGDGWVNLCSLLLYKLCNFDSFLCVFLCLFVKYQFHEFAAWFMVCASKTERLHMSPVLWGLHVLNRKNFSEVLNLWRYILIGCIFWKS